MHFVGPEVKGLHHPRGVRLTTTPVTVALRMSPLSYTTASQLPRKKLLRNLKRAVGHPELGSGPSAEFKGDGETCSATVTPMRLPNPKAADLPPGAVAGPTLGRFALQRRGQVSWRSAVQVPLMSSRVIARYRCQRQLLSGPEIFTRSSRRVVSASSPKMPHESGAAPAAR